MSIKYLPTVWQNAECTNILHTDVLLKDDSWKFHFHSQSFLMCMAEVSLSRGQMLHPQQTYMVQIHLCQAMVWVAVNFPFVLTVLCHSFIHSRSAGFLKIVESESLPHEPMSAYAKQDKFCYCYSMIWEVGWLKVAPLKLVVICVFRFCNGRMVFAHYILHGRSFFISCLLPVWQ